MTEKILDWCIIGAGPAGIAAVGKLLKMGVPFEQILWIDPDFQVGDFGRYWQNVSSNTRIKKFHDYFLHYPCFDYQQQREKFSLSHFPEQETCLLAHPAEILIHLTEKLSHQINLVRDQVEKLDRRVGYWEVSTTQAKIYCASRVILAIGATPKTLSFEHELDSKALPPTINLYDALNPQTLRARCEGLKRIAVFGSSHSAVIIIKSLIEAGLSVTNFFHHPLKYALEFQDWILFDNTGLKGQAATWARQYMEGASAHLNRYYANRESIQDHLPCCDAAIYAVGFEARSDIWVDNLPLKNYGYNPHLGIIAPALFGLGIAFPEKVFDPYHNPEFAVGLWKFVTYLDRIMPVWAQYA